MSFQSGLAVGMGAGMRASWGEHPSPPCSLCLGGWRQPPSSEFTGTGGWGQISCGFGGLSRALLGWRAQPHEEGYQLMCKMAKELR